MGTVNYKTSDYITLGIKPYSYDMDEEDREVNYECDMLNVENCLAKYSFYYYHITIEPGYYEGFSLNIENNFPIAFDWYEEKLDAQKELTQLKKCLIECTGYGLEKCNPGWCTSYAGYYDTIKAIRATIKEMREEVKNTPTWKQYNKEA